MALDALILAAGRASRMGLPKALLPAGPHHTLLSRLICLALEAVDGSVVIVVGSERALMETEIARWAAESGAEAGRRLNTVVNPAYAEGQSTSLALGIRQTRGEGALVLLVDQPALAHDDIDALRRAWRGRAPHVTAVAASLHGRQRTPVILGRTLFPEIFTLDGDEGARRILRGRPSEVQLVEPGDGPWQTDVDDWDDYVRLASRLGWDHEPSSGSPPVPETTLGAQWLTIKDTEPTAGRRLAALRALALTALQARAENRFDRDPG